ncbi:MAG TPA: FGGY family carbohydrate kinase [Dehalococcoidia bacterium]|nr:FGGY family carbohydrate kinase [Dehalococcoidia bacterium]
MSGGFLLALDLGTTSVRAIIFDATGRAHSRAFSPLAVTYPLPGRVEQDAADMWDRSVDVMRRAIADAGVSASDIAGIGIATQRAAAVAWDARTMSPIAPVLGWQDVRTAERVAAFRAIGIPLTTLAAVTKFEWWMQHDDAVRDASDGGTLRLGTPDTWLTANLTGGGAHVTDPGNAASTALFDNASGQWSAPIAELFSVPAGALPLVVATNAIVGETPSSLLGAPVPVAARAGDQQAAMFGQGAHTPGDATMTLGTSAIMDLHTGEGAREAPTGAYALPLWDLTGSARTYCLEGTVITAGSAVDWLVDLGLARDPADASAAAAGVAASDGVAFVPALQGLGTPFADDTARAAFYGLTRGSTRQHLARAVLEGIAHRCVDVGEALDLRDAALRVGGGLARSDVLLQMIADYSGRDVLRAAEVEASALGAAFLAGIATGVFTGPEQCRQLLAAPQRFGPAIDPAMRVAARDRWASAIERTRC